MRHTDETTAKRRRAIWWIAAGVLVVLAVAQIDERRRFNRAVAVRDAWLTSKLEAQQALLGMMQGGAMPAKDSPLWARAKETMPFPPLQPGDYSLVARLRRAVALGAYATVAALLIVLSALRREPTRLNGALVAEAMLAASVLGTALMFLGPRSWGHWRELHPGGDAAGLGLVLIVVSLAMAWLVRRLDGPMPQGEQDHVGGEGEDHEQRREEAPLPRQAE